MFPEEMDYAALVARVSATFGEPASTDHYRSNEMTTGATRLLFVSTEDRLVFVVTAYPREPQ